MASILLYAGLLLALLGAFSLLVPLTFLRITSRRRGAVVLLLGLAIAFAAAAWPVRTTRVAHTETQIDQVMPAYQFHEFHSIRVRAPPARVFRAFWRVTPGDIRFFNTLMAIRSLPKRLGGGTRPQSAVPGYAIASYARSQGDTVWITVVAREDGRSFRLTILAPGSDRSAGATPLLDLFTRSGFLVLAEEPDCELVLGAVDRYWMSAVGGARPRIEDARGFSMFNGPDYAKVAFNLRVTDQGGGWCRVTSETRIVATVPAAGRKFAAYWRLIYPGSAIIRRSLLDAVKRRAERAL